MKQLMLIAVLGIAVFTNGCVVYPTPYGPGIYLGIPVAPAYGPYYGGYSDKYSGGYPGGYYSRYPDGYYRGYHHHRR